MKKAFLHGAIGASLVFGPYTNAFAESKVIIYAKAQDDVHLSAFQGEVEFVSRRRGGGRGHSYRGLQHDYKPGRHHDRRWGYDFRSHPGGRHFHNFYRPGYRHYRGYSWRYYPGGRYYKGYEGNRRR